MATEDASTVTTESGSLAKWANWIAALIGLWVLVSPFILSGSIAEGSALWSTVAAGLVILILAAYGAYSIRTAVEATTGSTGEWSAWLAALVGLWILVSPFVLSGSIATGTVMTGTVVAGLATFILAVYAGYHLHSSR